MSQEAPQLHRLKLFESVFGTRAQRQYAGGCGQGRGGSGIEFYVED